MTRILVVSNKFSPDYGGIETVSLSLAKGFVKKGFSVEVLTHTPEPSHIDSDIEVTRNPGPSQLLRSIGKADVVFHNNICLRFLWPAIFLRKPLVFGVHNWLLDNKGKVGFREQIKRFIIGKHTSISVSRAVKNALPFDSTLVYNSYDPTAFYSAENEQRIRHSVAFVGRLVQGKGCLVLIDALSLLRDRGFEFTCSFIGDGAERDEAERTVKELDLQGVQFHGPLGAKAIGDLLRNTEVLAVPSHYGESFGYGEAFGIVALEGVASGCFVITSDDGGLPEAVGDCGATVPQNDATSLADAIEDAWTSETWTSSDFRTARAAHLDSFSEETMVEGYSRVIIGAKYGTPDGLAKKTLLQNDNALQHSQEIDK